MCEISLFKKAYEKRIPILGICRGMQVINVALGGTLYQDINMQVKNSAGHRFQNSIIVQLHHKVEIIEGSKLYNILGKKDITVNSFHHQSIKDIGKGLRATAYSNDGIIEGIESSKLDFLIGVQWHPEELIEKYPMFKSIFKTFIDICRIIRIRLQK
jgi:putative glutamine amidotransferase